jgi:hypothetical protein
MKKNVIKNIKRLFKGKEIIKMINFQKLNYFTRSINKFQKSEIKNSFQEELKKQETEIKEKSKKIFGIFSFF